MRYRLSGVFLVLLSLAAAGPAHGQWQDAATDKQEINMQVPGMDHWTPGYWKSVDNSSSRNAGTGYHSQWRSIDDRGIHAYLTYQMRKRSFYHVTIKDMVDISFGQDYDAQFEGDAEIYESSNGDFEYIYFSIDNINAKRKCVGFVNMSRSRKKVVYGHYCLSSYEPMDKDLVGLLIDSINLNFQGSASTSTPSAGPSEIAALSEAECAAIECEDKDEQATHSLPDSQVTQETPSRPNSIAAKATPADREGFDGRWVFEITDTDNLSATDRRIVEIKDNKFTVQVSTNGWRGQLHGEINKYGRLVGQGTVSRMGLVSNNITIHFTPHYRSGGFQEDVQARARYPLTFRIKMTRDERVEALSKLE